MHVDPALPDICAVVLVVLILAATLRRLGQPPIVAYLLAGLFLGPSGFGVVSDVPLWERIGSIGVLLLLFFAGLEVGLPNLLRRWKTLLVGTILQIILSIACTWALGWLLDWSLQRIVLLGFIISLSSTAVVIGLLRSRRELDTPVGRLVIGILLTQDIAIVPMLVSVNFMGTGSVDLTLLAQQSVGIVLIGLVIYGLAGGRRLKLPFAASLRIDHELEVFAALLVCFGIATLTGLLGLSAALGAFVAGLVVASGDDATWIEARLEAFRIVTVSIFFVAIGAQIDLAFVVEHAFAVGSLVVVALLTNTIINACIFRAAHLPWRQAFYGGALLAQIGEFSFVLASVGLTAGLIETFTYQITLATIAITLVLSPFYIAVARRLLPKT